jgi:hypothetical protein
VGPAALAPSIFAPVAVVAVLAFTDHQIGAPMARWLGLGNVADPRGSGCGR